MVHTLLVFGILAIAFVSTGGLLALFKETIQVLWKVEEFTGIFWKVIDNLARVLVVLAVCMLYVILVVAVILCFSLI